MPGWKSLTEYRKFNHKISSAPILPEPFLAILEYFWLKLILPTRDKMKCTILGRWCGFFFLDSRRTTRALVLTHKSKSNERKRCSEKGKKVLSTQVGLILFVISSLHWLHFKLVSGETDDLRRSIFRKTDFSLTVSQLPDPKTTARIGEEKGTVRRPRGDPRTQSYSSKSFKKAKTTANRIFSRSRPFDIVNLEKEFGIRSSTNGEVSPPSPSAARLKLLMAQDWGSGISKQGGKRC